jgi:hypothetical protein
MRPKQNAELRFVQVSRSRDERFMEEKVFPYFWNNNNFDVFLVHAFKFTWKEIQRSFQIKAQCANVKS